MVFYFEIPEGNLIYMGKDKYENEKLIEYCWDEDVWFHVSDYSSAHVYVRLLPGETIESLPYSVVQKMCQLVKFNSIEGKKQAKVDIVYTMATNLKKTQDMDVGTIGYKDARRVKKIKNLESDKDLIRDLLKTQKESFPDLREERDRHKEDLVQQQKKVYQDEKRIKDLNDKKAKDKLLEYNKQINEFRDYGSDSD